jgi:cellobiose epimerase
MVSELETSNCWQMLEDKILPFWEQRMVDKEDGGFYGKIDGRNQVVEAAPKSIILNARILWTFSKAFRIVGKRQYKSLSDRAYQYIMHFFHDETQGGFYWSVDHKGQPQECKKQIYAQAFVLYAFSEYFLINKKEAVLDQCKEIYEIIEKHSFDHVRNGYLEAFTSDWLKLEDQRLSEKDLNAAKTMNTHLHILEAYTSLHRIWRSEKLLKSLENLIRLFENKFVSDENHLHLFFDQDWNLLSENYSYGHDIEFSWLYQEAILETGDSVWVRDSQELAESLVVSALEGLDRNGGLCQEGESGRVVDRSKEWWPQAEALVGLVNIWQQTHNDYYMNIAGKIWNFIDSRLVDPEGEWYWGLTKDNSIDRVSEKAGPWKCPYHNSRAMFELLSRLPE